MPERLDTESMTWRLTTDLLGVTDAEGKFMRTNPAWFTVLGRTAEDIESRLFFEFVHPDDIAKTAKAFVDIQRGQAILDFENRYRHKDGSYRWLSWNAVPEGGVFFCSARDITKAKENERAVAWHETETRLREQFISILGHDLRNPLAGAACAIEFLQDREPLSDRAKMLLDTASDSLQRMSRLIDDVLDFARARMGSSIGVDLRAGIQLTDVLAQTVQEIRLANKDTVIEEIYDFADPVTCDPDRIAQLVSNLLSNAVAHGEDFGPIQLHAYDAGGQIAVSVTNRGDPILPSVRELLFEPFKRVEPDSSENGLGLGLFIAKQIAEQHQGEIDVVSENGETTFTLRLPHGPRLAAVPDCESEICRLAG